MAGPSLDPTKTSTIKFLCSYGGKILPRYPDGKLRYLGGDTRVLAVPRSIPFSELLLKMSELCGNSVNLRCQLPTEDLDALVSIKSNEDLINLLEEYDRSPQFSSNLKIRAFLSLIPKQISPPPSSSASTASTSSGTTSSSSSSNNYYSASGSTPRFHAPSMAPVDRRIRQIPPPSTTVPFQGSAAKVPHCANIYHARHGNNYASSAAATRLNLVHNGNHWQ